MTFTSPAIEFLRQKDISFSLFVQPDGLTMLDEIARFRGQRVSQIVRSLVFRYSGKKYVLVLAQAGRNVDWKSLRAVLMVRRIAMATPEEVFQVTGYVVGAVSPFGLAQKLPVLVDQKILREEVVSMGSGILNVAIIIRVDNLLRALEDYQLIEV